MSDSSFTETLCPTTEESEPKRKCPKVDNTPPPSITKRQCPTTEESEPKCKCSKVDNMPVSIIPNRSNDTKQQLLDSCESMTCLVSRSGEVMLRKFLLNFPVCNTFLTFTQENHDHLQKLGLDRDFLFMNILLEIGNQLVKEGRVNLHDANWYLSKLSDIVVKNNPSKQKIILPQTDVRIRYRPLLSQEAITSDIVSDVTVSNIVVLEGGVLVYTHQLFLISLCIGDTVHEFENNTPCTDIIRTGRQSIVATLPFKNKLVIINESKMEVRNTPRQFYKVSHLKGTTIIVGLEMLRKTVYKYDWEEERVIDKFCFTDYPCSVAVGPNNIILMSFYDFNRIICYTMAGIRIFEIYNLIPKVPKSMEFINGYFYVVQGDVIYKISPKGTMSQRNIGINSQRFSVTPNKILVSDELDRLHSINISKDFWPRQSNDQHIYAPKYKSEFSIEGLCDDIIGLLSISKSCMLVIYCNMKAVLVTYNDMEICSTTDLKLQLKPSLFCRLDSSTLLVVYDKKLQKLSCPKLTRGQLIDLSTNYIQMCHMVSNRCLALSNNKSGRLHILLIEEDSVSIEKTIPLKHYNVIIAATAMNFVVGDNVDHKLLFYSSAGKFLFEKNLGHNNIPHEIFSDNLYCYVLFKKESILRCYNIHGEKKWQFMPPSLKSYHLDIFQGIVCVLDISSKKVLIYNYIDWTGCVLPTQNPYITNIDITHTEFEDKVLIGGICHLPNGQLAVLDMRHDCLLYINTTGCLVSTLPLHSTPTDICQWDLNEIGVTLPLKQQLLIIKNTKKDSRIVSLRYPYVQIRRFGKDMMLCFCDRPYRLDIVSREGKIIFAFKNIPSHIRSIEIDKESLEVLVVTKRNIVRYKTVVCDHDGRVISGGGGGGGSSSSSSKRFMVMSPSVVKTGSNRRLYCGTFDKMSVYFADENNLVSINNDDKTVIHNHVSYCECGFYMDLVSLFNRNVCVAEMLSSKLCLEDLTVSDRGREMVHPKCSTDRNTVKITCLVITENNLIVTYDRDNKSIKVFTFDGQLVSSVTVDCHIDRMCRWRLNTLVCTTGDYNKRKPELLVFEVESPWSIVRYKTPRCYKYISCLSNNQLVCVEYRGINKFYVVSVDDNNSNTLSEERQIEIPEMLSSPLTKHYYYDDDTNDITAIAVSVDNIIIVSNLSFIIFFDNSGRCLHFLPHYMTSRYYGNLAISTVGNNSVFVSGHWEYDKGGGFRLLGGGGGERRILCLTRDGVYSHEYLNKTLYDNINSLQYINTKGPRFVGGGGIFSDDTLYVEGLFTLNREKFQVSRLLTDQYPVYIKDFDLFTNGQIIVCDQHNCNIVKLFDEKGNLLKYKNVGHTVGGVCFAGNSGDVMVTLPHTQQIYRLHKTDLKTLNTWFSEVPYCEIWEKMDNIYCCALNEQSEFHDIKIEGEKLVILVKIAAAVFDPGLYFPDLISQGREGYNEQESPDNRGRSGNIGYKGRLQIRRGDYVIAGIAGENEISVRTLPHRTKIIHISLPKFNNEIIYGRDKRDYLCSKFLWLDDKGGVLLYRDSLTLISPDSVHDTPPPLQYHNTPLQQHYTPPPLQYHNTPLQYHNTPLQQHYTPPPLQYHSTPLPLQYTPPQLQQHYTPPLLQYHSTPLQQHYTPPLLQYHSTPLQQHYTPPPLQYHSTPLPLQYTPPQLQQHYTPPPLQYHYTPPPTLHEATDICQWNEQEIIVVLNKELLFFTKCLTYKKSVKTERYYDRIYKYDRNHLVCAGGESRWRYWDNDDFDYYYKHYYVDILDIRDNTRSVVCRGVDGRVDGVTVTPSGDMVLVVRKSVDNNDEYARYTIYRYRDKKLFSTITSDKYFPLKTPRCQLTTLGEDVYISLSQDGYHYLTHDTNIYRIPPDIPPQSRLKQYLTYSSDLIEVHSVLGLYMTDTYFTIAGFIPSVDPFTFLHFTK
ncbi:hypothetical protein Ahia01_001420400 [Argonauta hians]